MKRKITHVMISILLCVPVFLCADCGRATEPAGWKEPAAGGLQAHLRPAILQIFCGDYRGSGVVWEITDEEVTVAGSAHLLKNGDTCRVLCHAGIYYEARVTGILENCDVGFAVFPAEMLKEDGVELTAASVSGRKAEELVRGEELVIYGSGESVAEDFVEGYLIEAESVLQIDGYSSGQPLLLGGIVMEEGAHRDEAQNGDRDDAAGEADLEKRDRGQVDAGMSGSGVFDENGELLGILAGGDGESVFAAVPVWRIAEAAAIR